MCSFSRLTPYLAGLKTLDSLYVRSREALARRSALEQRLNELHVQKAQVKALRPSLAERSVSPAAYADTLYILDTAIAIAQQDGAAANPSELALELYQAAWTFLKVHHGVSLGNLTPKEMSATSFVADWLEIEPDTEGGLRLVLTGRGVEADGQPGETMHQFSVSLNQQLSGTPDLLLAA